MNISINNLEAIHVHVPILHFEKNVGLAENRLSWWFWLIIIRVRSFKRRIVGVRRVQE